MADLIFCGPLPPPVHGQSAATLHMLGQLEAQGLAVRVFDTGPGEPASRWRRVRAHAAAGAAVLLDPAPQVYLSVNENRGLFATALLTLTARVRGKAITLHHHSARALLARSRLFALLAGLAGDGALHLTQGSSLACDLQRLYGVAHARSYSNIGLVPPPAAPRPPAADGRIRLGHLSNLTEAKGVGRAVDTLAAALAAGLDAELVLAGPCADAFARATVERAQREFPDRFAWLGPLYGETKAQFFDRIDVFLFPTMHIPETQGIVNIEALSYGRPVVAYDRGCIGADLGAEGGLVIPVTDDFAARAVPWLRGWLTDPAGAFDTARRRFATLAEEHRAEHAALAARLAADGGRP